MSENIDEKVADAILSGTVRKWKVTPATGNQLESYLNQLEKRGHFIYSIIEHGVTERKNHLDPKQLTIIPLFTIISFNERGHD
jgi:hydroxymethylpyrimidine pyrophosphatase-like HAD family hydrolase